MKVIFFAVLMNIYAQNITFSPKQYELIDANITYYSNLYNLDKAIITKLIAVESSFNSKAVSNKNARGIMQLQPATAKDMAKRLKIENEIDLFDVQLNIKLGCFYMRYLLNYYQQDYRKALAAYNMGIGALKRNGEPYNETKMYINKILGEENGRD